MNHHFRIYLAIILHVLLAGCRQNDGQREEPNMTPTFSITDKNPMGMYVAHQALQSVFTSTDVEVNRKSFEQYFKTYTEYDYTRKGNAFCIFARQFYPDEQDMEALTDFVSNGNTLLVASNRFNERFLDKFHLRTYSSFSLQALMNYEADMEETGLMMKDSARFGRQWYRYFFYPLSGRIFRKESYPALPIVKGADTIPGAVVFKYGSGRIIAIANATAFTNYFLLTNNNYRYLQQVLGYLPDDVTSITWDTYYNKREREKGEFSAFQELMKHPPMQWAFWLTLLLAATWIINGIIRRQRVIEVVKPGSNTSVEFAQTIGRLYLLKRDNKNIAIKMITYFLEHVRSRYYISTGTGTLNNEFAQLLTAKSGQPAAKTEELLRTIERINLRDHISDVELLELNTLIKQFIQG